MDTRYTGRMAHRLQLLRIAQIIGRSKCNVTDYAESQDHGLQQEALDKGLQDSHEVIGKEIDDKYMEALKKLDHSSRGQSSSMASSLKIVYTPLPWNGKCTSSPCIKRAWLRAGNCCSRAGAARWQFPNSYPYPNPEDKKAFALALDLAKKVDADLVLATDPDADRLGVYAKDTKTGEYKVFTGNMSGMLICEYEMSQKKALRHSAG